MPPGCVSLSFHEERTGSTSSILMKLYSSLTSLEVLHCSVVTRLEVGIFVFRDIATIKPLALEASSSRVQEDSRYSRSQPREFGTAISELKDFFGKLTKSQTCVTQRTCADCRSTNHQPSVRWSYLPRSRYSCTTTPTIHSYQRTYWCENDLLLLVDQKKLCVPHMTNFPITAIVELVLIAVISRCSSAFLVSTSSSTTVVRTNDNDVAAAPGRQVQWCFGGGSSRHRHILYREQWDGTRRNPSMCLSSAATAEDGVTDSAPSTSWKAPQAEIDRRRNLAIISHPDSGKTTMTEKLLLYGGAVQQAGAVRQKADQRSTRSDFMEMEKERGISISSTVMNFEYNEIGIRLMDTPGHQDFSEDTYRALAAADNALMLLDGAKELEPQTRKLFEVCRLRRLPLFTFVNKLDRPALAPYEIMDQIQDEFGLETYPILWPIGDGESFKGGVGPCGECRPFVQTCGTTRGHGRSHASTFVGYRSIGGTHQ